MIDVTFDSIRNRPQFEVLREYMEARNDNWRKPVEGGEDD